MIHAHLVWLDLEMTGLDPQKDAIIEIAVVITNADLAVIAQGPSLIIYQPDDVLDTMSEQVRALHTKSGLLEQVQTSSISLAHAYEQVLSFLKEHIPARKAPLCGNTIYMDRAFLRTAMPLIDQYLHYRVIDVSSIKELIVRWYPDNPYTRFYKSERHRALDDVYESIAELKHYREHFFTVQKKEQ